MDPKPAFLTADELNRLLSVPDRTTALGIRNTALLLVLGMGGLKVGEVVGREGGNEGGLCVSDVDWNEAALVVRGKKGSRRVELPAQAVQYLKAWVEIRPQGLTDLLFTTAKGTRLSNRYVRRMLADYGQAAGIERPVKPSMLRHTFAARILKETGDLRVLSERLGLGHLAAGLRYLHDGEEEE